MFVHPQSSNTHCCLFPNKNLLQFKRNLIHPHRLLTAALNKREVFQLTYLADPNHNGVDLFPVIGKEFLDMTCFKVADLVLRLESDTHVGPVHGLQGNRRSETAGWPVKVRRCTVSTVK